MAAKRGPTLRAQWLGKQLREIREADGKTLKDVAQYMQRDPSSISRLEAGTHPARVPDVLAYVDLCGVSNKRERDALVQLARDVWQTGWWDRYAADMERPFLDRIWLESRATTIRSYYATVIPGLLQTESYAAAIIQANDLDVDDDHIRRGVEIRLTRQKVLERESFQLLVILDEAVLHRVVGDVVTLRDQIEHLTDVAQRPNIELSVLPYAAGAPPSYGGGFDLMTLADPYTDVGYHESAAGMIYVEQDAYDDLLRRFDRIRRMALNEAESLGFLHRALD